jgi:hypothetical protein
MSSLFQFERKVGWSEVIAAFALLVSLGALWYARAQVQVNLPDVQVASRTAIRMGSENHKNNNEIIEVLPFIVTNRGGRTVTLVSLEKDSLPPLLRLADGKVAEDQNLFTSFAVLEGTPDAKGFLADTVLPADVQPLTFPYVVNQSIESGRTKPLVLLLRIKGPAGTEIGKAKVLFNCRAVFSDGSTHRIAQAIGYQ